MTTIHNPKEAPVPENFQCSRCGHCCMWEGDVRVSDAEIIKIAHFLKISDEKFRDEYLRLTHDRKGLSIIDNAKGHCFFFKENPPRCEIQEVKPFQCSAFPFFWRFEGWEKVCGTMKENSDAR